MIAANRGPTERTDVTVPADLRQVRVLRLVVAGTLSLHPIGSELVDDLCSAVDEACTLVLGDTDTPGWLTLTLHCRPGEVDAVISGSFDRAPERGEDTVHDAKQLLTLFVDHHDIDLEQHRAGFTRTIPDVADRC